jgi:hypothetical protein
VSNKPNFGKGQSVIQMLASMDGAEIPGGCETCEAYQTMSVDGYGIGHITVHHDDDCPLWQRIQAKDPKGKP